MSTKKMEIPSEFICPITMEVMVFPMASRHGPNFERAAIVAWLDEGSEVCPLTRKPMRRSDLIHNRLLSMEIQMWHKANNLPFPGGDVAKKQKDDGEDESVVYAAAFGDVLCQMYGTSQCRYTAVVPAAILKQSTGTAAAAAVAPQQSTATTRNHRRLLLQRPSFAMPSWKPSIRRREIMG